MAVCMDWHGGRTEAARRLTKQHGPEFTLQMMKYKYQVLGAPESTGLYSTQTYCSLKTKMQFFYAALTVAAIATAAPFGGSSTDTEFLHTPN